MYIHTYQINNILNVYCKQLGQNLGPADKQPAHNHIVESQRRSIIDQVSVDITRRMAYGGLEPQFETILESKQGEISGIEHPAIMTKAKGFTYTLIDENNHKWTNTLPINEFRPLIGGDN